MSRFKVSFDFTKVKEKLDQAFTNASTQRLLRDIGDFIVERVQQQTRAGKDLVNSAKQPPLSPNYIRFRKRLATGTSRSKIQISTKYFRPAKSNLTLTGQLLESIAHKINYTKGIIKISPTGRRIKYREGDFDTNQELANDLAQRGREFLGLDETGQKRIRTMIIRAVRSGLKRK